MGPPSPMRAGESLDRTLIAEVRELLKDREAAIIELQRAAQAVPEPSLFESLTEVVNKLPPALSIDLATIRVADHEGHLHLVAATGCPPNEIRTRALNPLEISAVREMVAEETIRRRATSLRIRWLDFAWIGSAEAPAGTILVANRTERRPTLDEQALLPNLADQLDEKLATTARDTETVSKAALQLARAFEPEDPVAFVQESVAQLRPSERKVLELYADGMTTTEVAEVLVLSTHTVRTHVKRALRTLGVNRREEAVEIVRANRISQLP